MSIEHGGFDNLGIIDPNRIYGETMSDVPRNPEGGLLEQIDTSAVSALGQALLSQNLSPDILEHSRRMAFRYWGGRDFYGSGMKGGLPGVTSPDHGE